MLTAVLLVSNMFAAEIANIFRYPVGGEMGNGWLNDHGLKWLTEHNYGGSCGIVYHPGIDFNKDGTSGDEDLRQPVYATADGIVQESYYEGGSTWGNIILISHILPTSEMVLSVYGHLDRRDVNINAHVTKGQQIGTVGKGIGLAAHLHFEIRKTCMAGVPAKFFPCGNSGYDKVFVKASYYDPEVFIKNHNPVGRYSDSLDGFHSDGTSQAFINSFNRNYPKIGWPTNRNGGVYVHSWASTVYPSYSVWIQDFQGDMSSAHFGTDGQSAIILSDYLQTPKAFLIKEGMWGYYKTHNGQYELGAPFTEEITGLRYASLFDSLIILG